MKRLFQAAVFSGALFLGQSLLAQEVNSQKDIFYIERFTAERTAQHTQYQDPSIRHLSLNYQQPSTDSDSRPSDGKELEKLLMRMPVTRTFYNLAADKEPLQLFHGRISLNVFSSGKNSSPGRVFYYPGNPMNSLYGPLPGTSFNFSRKRTSAGNSFVRWVGKKIAAKRMRK